jgi:hypothetical protein
LSHITHTIQSANSLIYILDETKIEFLIAVAKIAIESKTRVYFCHFGADTKANDNLLKSRGIPIHQLSGMSWDSDGLSTTFNDDGIRVESPAKFADVIFHSPIHSGKWYYEVTIDTTGICQIGWANEKMDVGLEVKIDFQVENNIFLE